MWRRFIRLCVLLFPLPLMTLPAHSATIENFVIVNSHTLGLSGGQFNGGGTYFGSFSLDTSLLSSSNNFPLTSFDITTTGPVALHFTPSGGFTGTYNASSVTIPGLASEQFVTLQFQDYLNVLPCDATRCLTLDLIEPTGTFSGGLVYRAQANSLGLGPNIDNSGSALIVDPAVLSAVAATPLPAALPLFASGLGGLALFGWRRKKKLALAAPA